MKTTQLPLFSCPLCQRAGFTAQGIRGHRCPQLPTGNPAQPRARLPQETLDRVFSPPPSADRVLEK